MDVTLPRLPKAATQIAGAVLTTPLRPAPTAGLPERRVLVRDVKQSIDELAAYNRVCGFALRDAVPSTWIHVLTFPLQTWVLGQRDFPFPLVGLVHVTNSIEQYRPVGVGERLELSSTATNLAPHRRGVVFDMVGEARVDGELVWRGVSNYLARGVSLDDAPSEDGAQTTPGAPADSTTPEAPADSATPEVPADPTAPDARTGETPPTIPEALSRSESLEGTSRQAEIPVTGMWRLPSDLGRRYAGVSGDVNPIHLTALTARPLGFKRHIIHGMWTYARALAALDGRLPEAYRVDGKFSKPIFLPGKVSFGEVRTDDGYKMAVTNREGKPYLTMSVRELG